MSDKLNAAAKDAEGKIQSAVGSLTGDTENKVKGEAKQVQAKAMEADAEMKDEVKKAAKKLEDAAN